MSDNLAKPIEIARSTVAVADGPAQQTAQPVQRRIVGPMSPHLTTVIPIARPILPEQPDIETELAEVGKAWRMYRPTNSRDAVYIYLSKVFQVVSRWQRLGCAVKNARVALRLRANAPQMKPEPFAIVIFCTSDADAKTRSKWSRALRYTARVKPTAQPVANFIKSKGGLNEVAREFAESTG